jgi:hypothetical protein
MRLGVLSWRDLDHPRAGGSEVYVQRLTRLWASWGHDVTLLCAEVAGQPARTERDGYRIVRRGGRFGVYRAARRVYLDTLRGCVDAVIDVINTRPFLTPGYVEEPVIALAFQVADDVAGLCDSVPPAGGVLVRPDPASLAAQLVARLPGWQAEGHVDLGDAGVVGWEETARVVLNEVGAVGGGRGAAAGVAAPR